MNGLLPQQIKTSRDNLLCVGRMSIKSVIERSCFETLQDRAPEVINFCNILEHILSFCTKNASRSIFSVDNKHHPWMFIRDTCRALPNSCVQTIETMENLKGYYAKLRGWIKLALLQKRLCEYLQHAVQQTTIATKYFDPRSLVRSPELNMYLNTLMGLAAVDFSFDLRGEDQMHPGLMCIDYTPFLHFTPSDESILDDALECDEHLDLNSKCPWQERFLKLELKYKREAPQKHFLEERVRTLDALMMSREREREQFETELRQMESVILELQVQITLLQEQYREELVKLGGNPDAVPNVPAARGHTSTLPPSLMTHRLAPVEPTRRPMVGHQQFSSGRRYSSPQARSRENLSMRLTPLAATGGREATFEDNDNEMWSEEDLERRTVKVPSLKVILFPEDESDLAPEQDSTESNSETNNSAAPQGLEDSFPQTPDIVRRLRDGEGKSASGYYRLMATPADLSNATSLMENSQREFFNFSVAEVPEPVQDIVATKIDDGDVHTTTDVEVSESQEDKELGSVVQEPLKDGEERHIDVVEPQLVGDNAAEPLEDVRCNANVTEQPEEIGDCIDTSGQDETSHQATDIDSEASTEQTKILNSEVSQGDIFRDSNGNGEVTERPLDSNGNGEVVEPAKESVDDLSTVWDSNDNGDFVEQSVRTIRDSNDNDGASSSMVLANGAQVS